MASGNGVDMDKIREAVMEAAQRAGVPVVEHLDGAGHEAEGVHRVHEEGRPQRITEALSNIIIAFDSGDMERVIRLFDEACEQRFEDGIQYARDTVGEWHRP